MHSTTCSDGAVWCNPRRLAARTQHRALASYAGVTCVARGPVWALCFLVGRLVRNVWLCVTLLCVGVSRVP